MALIINKTQTIGFAIDDHGELKTPKYFEESMKISTRAKQVLKVIVKHCITKNELEIPMQIFRDLLEKELPLNIKTVSALIELKTNNYIDINI